VRSVLDFLKEHPTKEKPVVIFDYAAVDALDDALQKAGHRVAVLDGRKTTQEKDLAWRKASVSVAREVRGCHCNLSSPARHLSVGEGRVRAPAFAA
jgi:hypothetical protein